MKKLILASSSPRRREILEGLHIPFTVEKSDYEEDMSLPLAPRELAAHLALGKAAAVAAKHTDAIVIGADTLVVVGNEVFGKPGTPELARAMLKKLSGTTHTILTGIALIDADSGEWHTRTEETTVTFRKLSDAEIEEYLETGEPFDKAGGYAIQGKGARFVEKIEGRVDNAVGLPGDALLEELAKLGIAV